MICFSKTIVGVVNIDIYQLIWDRSRLTLIFSHQHTGIFKKGQVAHPQLHPSWNLSNRTHRYLMANCCMVVRYLRHVITFLNRSFLFIGSSADSILYFIYIMRQRANTYSCAGWWEPSFSRNQVCLLDSTCTLTMKKTPQGNNSQCLQYHKLIR